MDINSPAPLHHQHQRPTSGLVLQPLDRLQQVLLLVQLALQEGVAFDDLVHPLLEVLQRHDGRPETDAVALIEPFALREPQWSHGHEKFGLIG